MVDRRAADRRRHAVARGLCLSKALEHQNPDALGPADSVGRD
ncbi:MAG: hypothetical protein QM729_07305 [Solirubrobacterales bacterium]